LFFVSCGSPAERRRHALADRRRQTNALQTSVDIDELCILCNVSSSTGRRFTGACHLCVHPFDNVSEMNIRACVAAHFRRRHDTVVAMEKAARYTKERAEANGRAFEDGVRKPTSQKRTRDTIRAGMPGTEAIVALDAKLMTDTKSFTGIGRNNTCFSHFHAKRVYLPRHASVLCE
jgi:hypothetical protein